MRLQLNWAFFGTSCFFVKQYLRGVSLAVGLVFFLAGCSSVPDAINPVEWYKSAKNAITGKESEDTPSSGKRPASELVAERNKTPPGANESFPSLGSVPERPPKSSKIERGRILEGLVSESETTRRHSKEVISRQGETKAGAQLISRISAAPSIGSQVQPLKQPLAAPEIKKKAVSLYSKNFTDKKVNLTKPLTLKAAPKVPHLKPTPIAPDVGEGVTLAPGLGYGPETVVVSGSGIELSGAGKLAYTTQTSASTITSGVRALEEFDPSQVRESYQVATILFNNGSSRLNSRDKRILHRVVAEQKKTGGTLRIIGHASSRTQTMDLVRHKMVNFNISAARADAVLKELVRQGINPNNLFVGSVSDTMPLYREFMPSGEAGNRRADIFADF